MKTKVFENRSSDLVRAGENKGFLKRRSSDLVTPTSSVFVVYCGRSKTLKTLVSGCKSLCVSDKMKTEIFGKRISVNNLIFKFRMLGIIIIMSIF